MSLVVGDLDNDGEGERIVIEPYHSSSVLSSETALLFLSVAILAAVTACCWCGFFVASKRKRLSTYLRQLHAPSEVSTSAEAEAKTPPRPSPAHSLVYAHYLQPHLNAGTPPLPPLPQLHTSMEMGSRPPVFKHIHYPYVS
ncbi:uncharacterized protein LOC125942702 [Dermacentor silvarum]|uniref:uncharacterized protein LOC125942702 n=1 Tax=Dermacentor silvarum TaxID=543639 RepID=UPI0021006CBC|nr:uncharacterized protein LOC125942702 [Dermacentor silvarum]